MAGDTHTVDLGDDDLLPPWSTVFDVIEATDTNDWVLVGGLMVQLHARRANIPPPRATKDVDLVVDVAANSASVTSIATALRRIGFEPIVPANRKEPIYRFQRDAEQVDLMVADHLPARLKPRFMMRPAFAVTAGEQSLRRRDTFVLTSTTRSVTLGAPDLLGALIGKGAAYIVDSRDTGRHLDDAAVLLASIDSVGDLDLATLSANDRKRLVVLARTLSAVTHTAWLTLAESHRTKARRNLEALVSAAPLDLRS
ncbi:MAG TPA: nucleotidyl transferase AbiEii/AbiGii toxin family protein [Galbitalea sp.]|jgi:hypothetical protein|nr:nucleotidyl transferase AbiEii/AbiGii toxin family protein [Galbitalea sp.]